MANVIGGDAVILYGLDSNGVPVPLKLNSDGTLSASNSGNLVLGSTPSTQAIGDTAAAGASLLAAPELHKHGMPSFGNPIAVAYANAGGGAATLPRSDHVHQVALTSGVAAPVGDVNITPAGNNIDIASVSLVAGTYILIGTIAGTKTTTGTLLGILWDGTTGYQTSFISITTATNAALTLVAIVTLGSTITVKLSGRCDAGSFNAVSVNSTMANNTPVTRLWYARIG